MNKGWTTTKLLAAGGLGVLATVLQLFGGGIVAVTGIPGLEGAINAWLTPALIVISLFTVNQFGAATIMRTVNVALQIPLPLSGPPGYLPKVPMVIVGAIIVDIIYLLLRRNKRIASLSVGGVHVLYFTIILVEVGRLFNMPGVEQTAKLARSPALIAAGFVVGAIGGYLGFVIYQKIKDTTVIQRIQAN